MPIVDLAPSPLTTITGRPEGFAVTPGKDEIDHGSDTPDFLTHPTLVGADTPDLGGPYILGAAFRQGNIVGSAIARQDWSYGTGDESGFNPWDAIKGTKYEPRWDSFVDIRSTAAADARKRQLDMEEEDRRTLAGAPWYKSFPAQLLAGAADIPSLLPGGAFVRGAQGGFSIARSAAVTGLAAGAGVSAQELALHVTQQTRTLGESGINIGASVFLGGLLGAGGAKLLSHAEWNRSVALLNSDLARRGAPPPFVTSDTGAPHIDAVLSHPDVTSAIENPKINRTQDVPYTAGPDKTGNGLNIDRHFPERFAVNEDGSVVADAREGARQAIADKNFGLASDLTTQELKGSFPEVEKQGNGWLLPLKDSAGGEIGHFEFNVTPDAVVVRHPFIESEFQGKGEGVKAYQRLVDFALKSGREFWSDRSVSAQAARMYGALERRGYTVMRDPTAETSAAGVVSMGQGDAAMKIVAGPVERNPAAKTFDPAQPFAVHEFAERHAMNTLIAGGMDEATAYKVAHWEIGEPAEGAWYKSHGIDQAKAEAAYQPFIDKIQHERLAKGEGDVPANLFTKPYPHDNVNAVSGEKTTVPKPTAEEIARGREILAKGEAQGAAGSGAPASVGAAAHEPVSIEGNTIAGRAARVAAMATKKLNPFMRVMQNPSSSARSAIQRLDEFALYTEGNFANIASPRAAATMMKRWQGGVTISTKEMDQTWKDYRKNGGQLSYPEFRDAVGKAMRREDNTGDSFIDRTAKLWRDKVVEPLKDEAEKVGLLPEDVKPDFAKSYFSRMWNRNRIIGEEQRFKDINTEFFNDHMGREWEKDTAALKGRLAKLEQEKEDIGLPSDERTRRLADLEQGITEHDIRGGDLTEKADRLNDLVAEQRRAKDAGDEGARTAAKTEADAIRKAGGADLKAFMTQRTNLRARRRNVDLGAAGLEERRQQITETLADLEEANQRSLGRLVKKGQKLERELDKIDPDDLAERIGDMRQNFVDVASRADAAADRADEAIAKIKEDAEKRAERADTNEDKARVAQAEKKGGVSLLPFLAKRGGISVDDPLAADIRSIFGGNPVIPGHGRLIRKGGRKLDESREAALEAGYLTDEGGAGPSTSTIRDLLEAMDAENRGNKRYRPGEEPSHGFDLEEERARMEEAGYSPRLGRSEKGAAALDAAEAKIAERLEKHAERQRALADRMETISRRLDISEGFDREGAVAELRAGVEKAIAETSNTSLGRGERAQRMQERLAALDPQRIKDRTAAIDQMKKDLERAYYDRWETKRLGGGVDLNATTRPDFTEQAKEIAEHLYNTYTGRSPGGIRPEFAPVAERGPMKDRTNPIPDLYVSPVHGAIEDFLESDVGEVMKRYSRVMGADVEIKKAFGSLDLKDEMDAITRDYARLRQGVTDPARLRKFADLEKQDKIDITETLNNIRGTRQTSGFEQDYGSIIRSASHFQYMLKMGEVTLSSLQDAVRPAMVHGIMPYMRTIGQLATNLKAVKLQVHDAQLMGNISEVVTPARLATIADINDPFAKRGPIEAVLANMTDKFSAWNGIRLWTDGMKSIASVMTQNRILENAMNWARLDARERSYMQMLSINQSDAERIAAQFAAHGQDLNGVKWANVNEWGKTDPYARDAFAAAMNKDVDSIVVIPAKADVPLLAHTAVGKTLLQFKSFTLASHQRVMLRGLQESPARFIGGAIAMTALGMLQVYLKAVSGNHLDKLQNIQDNPGWWIGEAIDRASFLPVFMELSNDFEKVTNVNPIKSPLKIFDKGKAESEKVQGETPISLAGPTVGSMIDAYKVLGIGKTLYESKDITKGQQNAAVRLMPGNSYLGLKQFLNYWVNPPDAR